MSTAISKYCLSLTVLCAFAIAGEFVSGQEVDLHNTLAVVSQVNSGDVAPNELTEIATPAWWSKYVNMPIRPTSETKELSLNDLLYLTLVNSEQIKVYSEVPLIRETSISEAAAAFDWSRFAENAWNDISEPVGSTLTVGGTGNRFNDHRFTTQAGVRKKTLTGAEMEIAQRVGFQSNNSSFFIPDNQATTQLSLGFTQPLMRGRGSTYNQSLIVLAHLDVGTAQDEFSRQLQSHLLEVTRAYWALNLERASLVQKVKLYETTKNIVSEIEARQAIDAQQSQLISARAALENRRADLIRAQSAVLNAETRMRALTNAVQLGQADETEVVPTDLLNFNPYPTNLETELTQAIQNRPEVASALKEIRAACIRQNIAQNEVMPKLNLVTKAYVSGLKGDTDFGQAWVDQFGVGAPSYTVGLQYEVPFGNRAARARLDRRTIEIRQLQAQYFTALETVKAEVVIAVRELETSFRELIAKHRALSAATAEAESIQDRWKMAVNGNGNSTLTLESLLRAQERVTETENSLVTAQLTYNLAIANLRRANGTLLNVENISIGRTCEDHLPRILLDKAAQNSPSTHDGETTETRNAEVAGNAKPYPMQTIQSPAESAPPAPSQLSNDAEESEFFSIPKSNLSQQPILQKSSSRNNSNRN